MKFSVNFLEFIVVEETADWLCVSVPTLHTTSSTVYVVFPIIADTLLTNYIGIRVYRKTGPKLWRQYYEDQHYSKHSINRK